MRLADLLEEAHRRRENAPTGQGGSAIIKAPSQKLSDLLKAGVSAGVIQPQQIYK